MLVSCVDAAKYRKTIQYGQANLYIFFKVKELWSVLMTGCKRNEQNERSTYACQKQPIHANHVESNEDKM